MTNMLRRGRLGLEVLCTCVVAHCIDAVLCDKSMQGCSKAARRHKEREFQRTRSEHCTTVVQWASSRSNYWRTQQGIFSKHNLCNESLGA